MGNCHLFVKATLNGCAAATDDKEEKKETRLFREPSGPSASQVIIEAFPQKKNPDTNAVHKTCSNATVNLDGLAALFWPLIFSIRATS